MKQTNNSSVLQDLKICYSIRWHSLVIGLPVAFRPKKLASISNMYSLNWFGYPRIGAVTSLCFQSWKASWTFFISIDCSYNLAHVGLGYGCMLFNVLSAIFCSAEKCLKFLQVAGCFPLLYCSYLLWVCSHTFWTYYVSEVKNIFVQYLVLGWFQLPLCCTQLSAHFS